ncbi:hypothetical protein LPJ78_003566 [Coemansia sp. RSA 989]|nr:hypothetical protein BX667DRAFT_508294 [Coemansia mojavensis]KAJ1741556.1 hypothetical protein LPJ68_002739 [Coemansia sp. RSA 1086]KAJ1864171.1 hypothetical protein LPJ78_003566 [Coemansia sp. RSA 989]KAJ2673925.1 hypothetical protein IWW42_002055 [Coemansia sp. RSA 1085]
MNLSGLSYLQLSLVDALIAVYLFLRIHDTQNWSSINPIAVLRQGRSTRSSAMVTLVAFYSCLAATVLFLAKDAIMAKLELDDVELCRTAVYLQQTVTPLDNEQLPDVKVGLLLWNLAAAFHMLGLGCMMCLWASSPMRRLLGRKAVMGPAVGLVMLVLGVLGWAAVVASHFAAFGTQDNTANARSISRIVSSGFTLLFMALLAWIVVRVWLVVRQARRRDPFATATFVSTTQKLHAQGGYPMATLQHLLGIQMLSFMNSHAVLLVLVLMLRGIFFLVFDISFLTPPSSAIQDLGANNAYTGIATLSASLVSLLIVLILFPRTQEVLVDVLSGAAEMGQSDRMAFIDAQLKSEGTVPMPRLTATMTSRDRMLSNATDRNYRSRAPTTASLAVEKLMSSTNTPTTTPKTPAVAAAASASEDSEHFLSAIPYIDNHENSFFSQGPWSQPVTHTLSSSPAMQPGDRDSSTVAGAGFGTPQVQSRNLEELVRSNTGSSLVTIEGRQDMLRQAVLKNEQSRSHVNSSFIPLSSSNLALNAENQANSSNLSSSVVTTASTHQSGPSLYAEILRDPDNEDPRPDSIVSSYIRPDNALPTPKPAFAEPRPLSLVLEEYQYDPTAVAPDSNPKNPFDDQHQANTNLVFVASPQHESENVNDDADDTRIQPGVGPILIRKGSKASLRRKGTLERRKQRQGKHSSEDSLKESNSSGSMSNSAAEVSAAPIPAAVTAPAEKPRNISRMSAFNGSPSSLPQLLKRHGHAEEVPEMRRDSSTISNMSWEQKTKAQAPFVAAAAAQLLQNHANLPSSLFRQSIASCTSSRQSNDVFSSLASMSGDNSATNDAFFTPEASLAQMHQEEIRPSTAPSSSQRHTLPAHEHTLDSPETSEEVTAGGARVRRAQTLRKAVDTDAPAMESSIGESTGELISALPMPSTPSNDRVIL